MKKTIPSSIVKRSAAVPQPNAVFILLDGIAYCEIAEYSKKDFVEAFKWWKKETYPTLGNSIVRFFHKTNNSIDLKEGLPILPKKQ